MAETRTETRSGGCLCGAVRLSAPVTVAADGSIAIDACHCGMCRRWSGGGPVMALQPAGAVAFEDETAIGLAQTSDWAERGFCSKCGSNLFWRLRDGGHVSLMIGVFDDPSGFRLETEIFVDHQPGFYAFEGERKRMTGAEVIAAFAPKT